MSDCGGPNIEVGTLVRVPVHWNEISSAVYVIGLVREIRDWFGSKIASLSSVDVNYPFFKFPLEHDARFLKPITRAEKVVASYSKGTCSLCGLSSQDEPGIRDRIKLVYSRHTGSLDQLRALGGRNLPQARRVERLLRKIGAELHPLNGPFGPDNAFVHRSCALWSQGVVTDRDSDGILELNTDSVSNAIRESKAKRCSECDLQGASVQCCHLLPAKGHKARKRCGAMVHFPCTLTHAAWKLLLEPRMRAFCPEHVVEVPLSQITRGSYAEDGSEPAASEILRRMKVFADRDAAAEAGETVAEAITPPPAKRARLNPSLEAPATPTRTLGCVRAAATITTVTSNSKANESSSDDSSDDSDADGPRAPALSGPARGPTAWLDATIAALSDRVAEVEPSGGAAPAGQRATKEAVREERRSVRPPRS